VEIVESDRSAAEALRCPYCRATQGHALVNGRDCPGWALDDESIRRGHPNRAQVFAEAKKAEAARQRRNARRRERDQAMRDLGLRKVRGNLGGTYWE
jgi:hypothetical protein